MKNPLITFLAGLALSVTGLYLLFQMVHVNLGFGGLLLGNHYVSSGIVMIPFIIGIVWIFVNPKSIFAKLLVGIGVLAYSGMYNHKYPFLDGWRVII